MKKIALIATMAIACVLPLAVLAQTPLSIENVGSTLGLGTADLKASVLNILQWVLGLLGLIAVIMIIIGGITLLVPTSAEAGEKAKKIITGAVIGLVVILLAWAIIIFVINTTTNVTV
ncbi:MAG: hypothetical protein WC528_01770 [Patescibacteria group bacterium]